jgi:hypothetical protein
MLYTSPPPQLILAAARLLAVKSLASGCACVWAAHSYLLLPAALPLTAAALAAPLVKASLGLGALSSLSALVSSAILSRTVLSLQVGPADPTQLHIATPRLLSSGTATQAVPLASVQGASSASTVQGFRVDRGGGRLSPFYLFPVEPHWRSSDLPALRRLLFAQYFREGEAAAAAAAVGSYGVSGAQLTAGIAGFGPFRPAAYADPQAAQQLALGSGAGAQQAGQAAGGSGGAGAPAEAALAPAATLPAGLRQEHGTVWAEFTVPPPATLEERRARERERKGGQASPPTPLPTLPAAAAPPK